MSLWGILWSRVDSCGMACSLWDETEELPDHDFGPSWAAPISY